MTVSVLPDAEAVAAAVADAFTSRLAELQSDGAIARVALTGGRIASRAYELVSSDEVDWSRVEFWWGDERFVPEGHSMRNDQQARDAFLTRLAVPDEHIHSMPAHGCDLSMADAADNYATTLPESFDLVLLGVGEDGHVASVFPGSAPTDRLVVEVWDSPKPPAQRITLTLPALSSADAVWFIASGPDKADAVAKAQLGELPAGQVRGATETWWWLDSAAAGV